MGVQLKFCGILICLYCITTCGKYPHYWQATSTVAEHTQKGWLGTKTKTHSLAVRVLHQLPLSNTNQQIWTKFMHIDHFLNHWEVRQLWRLDRGADSLVDKWWKACENERSFRSDFVFYEIWTWGRSGEGERSQLLILTWMMELCSLPYFSPDLMENQECSQFVLLSYGLHVNGREGPSKHIKVTSKY